MSNSVYKVAVLHKVFQALDALDLLKDLRKELLSPAIAVRYILNQTLRPYAANAATQHCGEEKAHEHTGRHVSIPHAQDAHNVLTFIPILCCFPRRPHVTTYISQYLVTSLNKISTEMVVFHTCRSDGYEREPGTISFTHISAQATSSAFAHSENIF